MPEIKNQFTKGKMNKDLDERLVPKGEYRDAMNIQVSTSEESEVGTVQNILGNKQIGNLGIEGGFVVGCIADEKIDTLYYLVWSEKVDFILSYKRGEPIAKFVFRDVNKNVLKFNPNNTITGINVIDGMLFFTDNENEPKKINIARCEAGTPGFSLNLHTKLINESSGLTQIGLGSVDIEEKHITVIKKAPTKALQMDLSTSRDPNKIYTGVVTITNFSATANNSSFVDPANFNFSSFDIDDTFEITLDSGLDASNNVVNWPSGNGISDTTSGLTGWQTPAQIAVGGSQGTIPVGTKVVFKEFDENGDPPNLPVSDFAVKGIVQDADTASSNTVLNNNILVKVTSISGAPALPTPPEVELQYVVDLFEETEKLFEFKFPRFSYRYKYEDGEYSPFAPFTQVAFIPGSFDYHPRKGYNLGMTNKLAQIKLGGFIHDNMPEDVVSVDILFKDEPSPNIYIVDTISPNDAIAIGSSNNVWYNVKSGGLFEINSEAVNSVVPSNQLLRPWDNVPRKALAQDITGSRVVYGNYVQNYDLNTANGEKYFASFEPGLVEYNDSISGANKSIKSLREYQLGVVFIDEYGRETPVISNPTGTIQLGKEFSNKNNRFKCRLAGQDVPQDLTYYKFFIKETSNEYYNMAMDRFYEAEDGNIWLAFPSSDRNKIDIDTFLILKKGTDSDDLVTDAARYKVLAIEAEAPDYIKTSKILISSTQHNNGGTGGNNDMFGGANPTFDVPFPGESEFQMNFKPFHGTTGQNLDTLDKDLYIQFGKVGINQVSERYRISSITSNVDTSSSATGALVDIDGNPAKYSVKLENPLGEDVGFITDSPTNSLLASRIEDGAKVFVYKYEVENKPQFDGRFFVKIHNDDTFKSNVVRTLSGDLDFRVKESRRLYGLKDDHISRHTSDAGRFLVNGHSTDAGSNDWDNSGNPSHARDWMLGYYLDDEFSSFALYFRRYLKEPGNTSFSAGAYYYGWELNTGSGLPGSSAIGSQFLTDNGTVDKFAIRHLGPAVTGTDVTYDADQTGQTDWQMMPTHELFGMTARWKQSRHPIHQNYGGFLSSMYWTTYFPQSYLENFTTPVRENDKPQDTSVWFIDMGPSKRKSTSLDNSLYLDNIRNNDYGGYGSTGMIQGFTNNSTRVGNGIVTDDPNDKWDMEIGFGGIEEAQNNKDPLADFFNVGDWFTPSGLGQNLNHSSESSFVENITINLKFKFKEDKDQRVYTILGSPEEIACIRHSHVRHEFIGYLGTGATQPFMSSAVGTFSIPYQATLSAGFASHKTQNEQPDCKAEGLSFNFTKNWNIKNIQPKLLFNPTTDGIIGGSGIDNLQIAAHTNPNTGSTCDGTSIADDLKIYVEAINQGNLTLHIGMALHKYHAPNGFEDTLLNHLGSFSNEFLVIRNIVPKPTANNIQYYELWLGGYRKPIKQGIETVMASGIKPQAGSNYTFVQVGVNGYSPNSEFNINTMGDDVNVGKVGAVGYTLQFVEEVEPEEVLSENPAIFETEPKDSKDLDIYYEATSAIPIEFNENNIHEAFPIGSVIDSTATIIGYDGMDVVVDNSAGITVSPPFYFVERPDGLELNIGVNDVSGNNITIDPFLYNGHHRLNWHNCYSFGNGVESNRIRDNFNLPFISNGVKVSTTLEGEYKEEHRKYGLIYSGLYNSVSGVNNLNQFIQAEKITKDINPIYGSIQKLHSRDSDLVTLCEDKCLRILANKDAVFNAGGNTNLTATENVLGQTIPFSGEYGISTNPESFASESYRAYFADKVRGVVIRLSKDGITPISNYGMKDWFKDNLKLAERIIGSHDDKKGEYNITLKQYPVVKVLGASKAIPAAPPYDPINQIILTPQQASSLNVGDPFFANGIPPGTIVLNKQQLSPQEVRINLNTFGATIDTSTYGLYKPYGTATGGQVFWSTTLFMDNFANDDKTLSFKERNKGWVSFKSFTPEKALSMANDYYSFKSGNLFRHHEEQVDRNTFYNEFTESSVTVVLNQNPSVIKGFNTLNYEGSQSKIDKFSVETKFLPFQPDTDYSNQNIYNLSSKDGWYVDSIITDKEQGNIKEFIEKEGKWFNNINRFIDTTLTSADTADFTFQGIGEVSSAALSGVVTGPVLGGAITPVLGTGINTTATTGVVTTATTGGAITPDFGTVVTTTTTTTTGTTTTATTGGAITPDFGNVVTTTATTSTGTTTTSNTVDEPFVINQNVTEEPVMGCTNPNASNYNPLANVDDGSCILPPPKKVPSIKTTNY